MLVVSLGVDGATEDLNSPFVVTEAGFRRAGAILATLDLPTVFVQEGGYDLELLGPLGGQDVGGISRRSLLRVGIGVGVAIWITELLGGTPDEVRGRVNAVNRVFIGASNELGAFESGSVAALTGPVFAVVSGGVILVRRGTTGRFLDAVRGSSTAAQSIGINPARQKLVVFVAGSAVAGFGGGLLASYTHAANYNQSFTFFFSLVWVVLVITAGARLVQAAPLYHRERI